MSTHTPGPWVVADQSRAVRQSDSLSGVVGELIVDCFHPDTLREMQEVRANARLIASAPELLEALQRLLSAFDADQAISPEMPIRISCETNGTAMLQAQAAIAKATGKGAS